MASTQMVRYVTVEIVRTVTRRQDLLKVKGGNDMSKVYNREDLNEGDICAWCKKDLRTVDEIHVVEGQHFCSKACAVHHQTDVIIASAKDMAIEWYDDCAEIVIPSDIGIK